MLKVLSFTRPIESIIVIDGRDIIGHLTKKQHELLHEHDEQAQEIGDKLIKQMVEENKRE